MKQQMITLRLEDSSTREVKATVNNNIAVHKSHVDHKTWVVTHVPTGHSFLHFEFKKNAVGCANEIAGMRDWNQIEFAPFVESEIKAVVIPVLTKWQNIDLEEGAES